MRRCWNRCSITRYQLPEGCDVYRMFLKLRELEEEIPELHIVWEKQSDEIHAQVMGEVQIEILKSLIKNVLTLQWRLAQAALFIRRRLLL